MNRSMLKFVCAAVLLISANGIADENAPTSPAARKKTAKGYSPGEILDCQCKAAYNAPAAIMAGCSCSADYFFDASYIYWYAREGGLKIAKSTGALSVAGGTFVALTPDTSHSLYPDFRYQSGFKVGAGFTSDEWTLEGEYTWVRNHTKKGLTPAIYFPGGSISAWQPSPWIGIQAAPGAPPATNIPFGSEISASWRLGMDIADLNLSRPYYEARNLTVKPFASLRAAWIRQSFRVQMVPISGLSTSTLLTSRNHSHNWGIGPRFGFDANYLMCWGLRLQGDFAASLLYTRFTKVSHREDAISALTYSPRSSFNSFGCLLPNVDMGLGLGWGSYLYGQQYHIDFSAAYDFMYFWGQNEMQPLATGNLLGNDPTADNLYLHGLTIAGRFDF